MTSVFELFQDLGHLLMPDAAWNNGGKIIYLVIELSMSHRTDDPVSQRIRDF